MEEVFLRIEDYPNYYVSNLGNVLTLNYNHTGKERILKPKINRDGYFTVQLWNGNGVKEFSIHRLVANAFILNPDNLPCVNHKDENHKNNKVDNLEWCSVDYNIHYGTGILRRSQSRKRKIGRYDLNGRLLQVYDGAVDAVKEGYRDSAISCCLHGKYHTHHGYRWKFID